jgi:hypothetical protein
VAMPARRTRVCIVMWSPRRGPGDGPSKGHAAQGTEGTWTAPVAQVTPR